MGVKIKRIYEPAEPDDGYRVLVDRLWPRGVSKEKAKLDLWLKDIAPSDELRQWFGHKPERFEKFTSRYLQELYDNPTKEVLRQLTNKHQRVTLLYSAHDPEHNQAVVLQKFLTK